MKSSGELVKKGSVANSATKLIDRENPNIIISSSESEAYINFDENEIEDIINIRIDRKFIKDGGLSAEEREYIRLGSPIMIDDSSLIYAEGSGNYEKVWKNLYNLNLRDIDQYAKSILNDVSRIYYSIKKDKVEYILLSIRIDKNSIQSNLVHSLQSIIQKLS